MKSLKPFVKTIFKSCKNYNGNMATAYLLEDLDKMTIELILAFPEYNVSIQAYSTSDSSNKYEQHFRVLIFTPKEKEQNEIN